MRRYRNIPCRKKAQTAVHRVLQELYSRYNIRIFFNGNNCRLRRLYFSESNSAYLTRDQLEGLSKDQLAYARNEIYARHGRRFQDQMFQDYFNAKSWYVPQYDPDQFDAMQDTIFNEYEKSKRQVDP